MDKELTIFFINDSKEIVFYDDENEVELMMHSMENLVNYTKDIIKFNQKGYNILFQDVDSAEEYLEITEQYETLDELNMIKGNFIY